MKLVFVLVISLLTLAPQTSHAFGLRRPSAGSSTPTPTPNPLPTSTPVTIDPVGMTLPTGAPACTSTDPNHICIGLKLVSYTQSGVDSITQAQALAMMAGVNQVWTQCNIGFQLEQYEAVDPTTQGLAYNTNWESDGDTVRRTFNDGTSFLVVAVGSLSGSTIAVSEEAGGASVYGTLVEKLFATNPLTVGHELGHYQGLYHVSDSTNLMNPYIGANTEQLTSSQCDTARSTDYAEWQSMMRTP